MNCLFQICFFPSLCQPAICKLVNIIKKKKVCIFASYSVTSSCAFVPVFQNRLLPDSIVVNG